MADNNDPGTLVVPGGVEMDETTTYDGRDDEVSMASTGSSCLETTTTTTPLVTHGGGTATQVADLPIGGAAAAAAAVLKNTGIIGNGEALPHQERIQPHAFHLNLPPHHKDETTGQPYITEFANSKARMLVDLVRSIQLSEHMFSDDAADDDYYSDTTTAQAVRPTAEGTTATDSNYGETTTSDDTEMEEDEDVDAMEDDEEDPVTVTTSSSNRPPDHHYHDEDEQEQNPHTIPSHSPHHKETLSSLAKKCTRLQSQFTTLESLKRGGISQMELCDIVLHLLRLVTATVTFIIEPQTTDETGSEATAPPPQTTTTTTNSTSTSKPRRRRAVLHYENVGYIYHSPSDDRENAQIAAAVETVADLERDLDQDFALPSPAREVLLSVIINILSNKGPLRSVSNAALYPEDDGGNAQQKQRSLLLLHWQCLLRTLLRTAPYLDERKYSKPSQDSSSRQSTVLKRTVQLIRDARHFFDQGIRPPGPQVDGAENLVVDKTAWQIWEMVKTDVMFHSHTHACYRAVIILYLFQPSRCTASYYLKVMPLWLESWTNIDRCPEYDFLWLALFCRARKYISPDDYDWGPVRRRLLTNCQYWLQLPIGGASLDKAFPRASNPRSRSCPPRLKALAGASSSYEEGIDFVAKVAKLLVASLGTGPKISSQTSQDGASPPPISEGTNDILRFMAFVTPYFNPSNLGQWTFTLGAFLHYFAYEMCCRVGFVAGVQSLHKAYPALTVALSKSIPAVASVVGSRGTGPGGIPAHEIVALMDALLPLCQQALYSKNGHVGRAGEAAMLYLVQIDPVHATPAFVEFATRALDITAVNLSHQAPSALSALTRLIQPALRSDPAILFSRLPDILRLSLAGIDSNDQNKTIRTLILYRSLASWVFIGGNPEMWPCISQEEEQQHDSNEHRGGLIVNKDGTIRIGHDLFEILVASRRTPEYSAAIDRLPETSLLKQAVPREQADSETQRLLLEEVASAMSDWVLEFLERVFGLLRASGEREKAGKTSSGVASRHSSAAVHQARNFSRVLKECLFQVFAAMDDETHALAVRLVCRFLQEETLPAAAKDSSLLCQAAAAARTVGNNSKDKMKSPGLDALIPILTDDLQRHSTKTLVYRLRCLAGAVRSASHEVVKHRIPITKALEFGLSSDDRHVFKTACKLLRHTLSTLVESCPVSSDYAPRVISEPHSTSPSTIHLGRSAQLHSDPIQWHVPNGASVEFAWELLEAHVKRRLDALCAATEEGSNRSKMLNALDINDLRRCLRVTRYSIRGASSVLLDFSADDDYAEANNEEHVPYERASHRIIRLASDETRQALLQIRGRLSSFLVVLSSVIASETLHPDSISELPENDPYRKVLPLISSDAKVCKETCDIALLLLTRRGASFRSQESRTIWKAQKQLATDFTLCAQVDHMVESLQSADLYGNCTTILYKDGEDAGKTIPRRLLVARVLLFHDSLQRNASFEIPRRLRRKHSRDNKGSRNILFRVKSDLPEMIANLESVLKAKTPRPLDAYEGIVDGLYALCCHSNTQVRSSAISVVDYAMTRFGWLMNVRVQRLLSAISMKDAKMNGKFGIPSCASLVEKLNQQGKRKRLAEAIKGVCSILALPRALKLVLGSEKMRFKFAKTLCGTDSLIALLPTEEMQKTVHYLQSIFSPFRSKFYMLPRATSADDENHDAMIRFALAILSEKKVGVDVESALESSDAGGAHWRKLLLACWFLMSVVDSEDIMKANDSFAPQIWTTCFRILESESGQPLQRVALGLFGKLVTLVGSDGDRSLLGDKMATDSFCRVLGEALVYDHKEDTSVGGGHDAQWSAGVEDLIRDASRYVAPRSLFPFQRTCQSMGSFKISHAQLVELILLGLSNDAAWVATEKLLAFSTELAASPPSEDQKNQQITSAEIFAGVCGAHLRRSREVPSKAWADLFLPHIDDVMGKIPFSLSGAYFDAIRYALQFCPPTVFYPLTSWLVDKVQTTLWQPAIGGGEVMENGVASNSNGSSHGTEGFTAQSKWLYLFSAVLIEMDETEDEDSLNRSGWYATCLTRNFDQSIQKAGLASTREDLEKSWKLVSGSLLHKLTGALGHPFDSCRDHISRCLFRICYCHRKRARITASYSGAESSIGTAGNQVDPGSSIVAKLCSLKSSEDWSFRDRYNALSTARRFISYCVHLGEAKFEYSDYVIPLLPIAFESLESTVEEDIKRSPNDPPEESAAKRALEAEVIKGFRYAIAEVSITAVISYGSDSDISRVLETAEVASKHKTWQVRHASAHFLRCFEGAHKFLFTSHHAEKAMSIVADLLADERREISSAAMAALTGILAASPIAEVARLVEKYTVIAGRSKMKRAKKGVNASEVTEEDESQKKKEQQRARNQQTSVFFLCAAILAQPYETPAYVPQALAAISTHSFERNAPLGVRDTVKRCCAEYKKTHMSDNWEVHRSVFTLEQLEALEDVVSSPHYYA